MSEHVLSCNPGTAVTDLAERSATSTILSGVEARDGLDTATMVSGYPGSPLGEFDLTLEAMGDLLRTHRILHRPGLNEELAAAIVWGSQMGGTIPYVNVDGVAGAWYG